jgi:hypothetical protein
LRPLAVLIAIVFGSAAAISFGLIATLVVLFVLRTKYPEFSHELVPLLLSSGIFLLILASSGASLYATLKSLRWRGLAMAAMCLIVIGAGLYLWPRP